MSATSLLAYFEPLMKWLEEANVDECLGWNCESFAADYMENEYETTTSYLYNQATIAEWNYETNLTEANGQNAVKNRVNLISRVRKSEIYLLSVDGMER